MFLNPSSPRKEHFKRPTVTGILRRVIAKDGPITVDDVEDLNAKQRLVGTLEGSLEDVLARRSYTIDSLNLVRQYETIGTDQLMILTADYRLPSEEAREALVYSYDTLISLDSVAVKTALLGSAARPGKISGKTKQQAQWSPEKVISTAFNILSENREELAEKVCSGYFWLGKDNHRRIVSLVRAINGAELRAYQNHVAFKKVLPVRKKELRLGKSAVSSYADDLTPQQIARRERNITRYEHYLARQRREGHPIGHYVKQLDVDFSDLIEPSKKKFAQGGGRRMRVPSRSRPEKDPLEFNMTGLALFLQSDPRAYSAVWNLAGYCHCEDKGYRSDRRRLEIDKGNDEYFFCTHEIAAYHALMAIHNHKENDEQEGDNRILAFSPFVLPTAEMMGYYHKLKYQTIMLEFDEGTKRFSKRSLNDTEIENLLWKKVLADGYERCFTTELERFRVEKYDPMLDLLRFEKAV